MKRLLFIAAALFILAVAYAAFVLVTMPDVRSLATENPKTTALIEQRARETNRQATEIPVWLPYSKISVNLRNAVLVAEDGAFFQHSGVDVEQVKESIKKNWEEKRFARGASTITQQLAKNLYLSTSKNPLRKIQELFIALEMEEHLSKRRIFEIYLNVIEWGDGIYGAEAAAQRYFGKPAGDLQPEEAAILAAMIPNPRRYTPDRRRRYLEGRKNLYLSRLLQYGYIDRKEYSAARGRAIAFRQPSRSR